MEISPGKKRIMKVSVIIGAIIIPLMYSFFYLGAFWDPYSRLDQVPVAIVNEDAGATINGEARNVGDEICDTLKEDGTLKFVFTTGEKAKKGVNGNKYYASITMPTNFSESIASAGETDKKVATLKYAVNEKRNYLASQILNNATNQIEKEIRSNVNSEVALTLANTLRQVPKQLGTLQSGFNQMYKGSEQLLAGTKKLDKGASDLSSGAKKLNDGAQKLDSGATTLKKGTSSLKTGTTTLNSGLGDLENGVKKINSQVPALKTGVSQLNVGMNGDGTATNPGLKASLSSYTKGVATAAGGLDSYSTALGNVINGMPATGGTLDATQTATLKATLTGILNGNGTSQNPGIAGVNSGLQTIVGNNTALNEGAAKVAAGTGQLDSKVPALETGLSQLQGGIENAKDGSGKLANGATSLNSGAAILKSGTASMAGSTPTLVSGTGTLKEGTGTLTSGMNTLNSGIKSGKDGVDNSIKSANSQMEALNGIDDYAANPVEVKKDEVDYVPNYGTAFAPYFLSLSLWVGGLIIFFGIYLDVDKRYKYLCRESSKPVVRSFSYLALGTVQALILAIVVKYALGLEVEHMTPYILSCILVSLVFVSIIQFCLVHLKDLGKFVALLLLILQLTSCGGTFPMETVPKFFQTLYPYMPMTYSVGLFKETISGATGSSMMKNLIVLISLLAIFTVATILLSVMKKGARHLRKMRREAKREAEASA